MKPLLRGLIISFAVIAVAVFIAIEWRAILNRDVVGPISENTAERFETLHALHHSS